jgi:hypothetical protein
MEEKVLCVLRNIKKPKFLGNGDAFNVAMTDRRTIFARLTAEMLKTAIAEANQRGKEEGKNFLSRWGDQLKASFAFGEKYLSMSPEDILKENPENFALENTDIAFIVFRRKIQAKAVKTAVQRILGEVTFESKQGKTTYKIDGYPTEDIEQMKRVFGGKVRE